MKFTLQVGEALVLRTESGEFIFRIENFEKKGHDEVAPAAAAPPSLEVTIRNLPEPHEKKSDVAHHDRPPATHFQNYYLVFRDVPPSERFEFRLAPGKHAPPSNPYDPSSSGKNLHDGPAANTDAATTVKPGYRSPNPYHCGIGFLGGSGSLLHEAGARGREKGSAASTRGGRRTPAKRKKGR